MNQPKQMTIDEAVSKAYSSNFSLSLDPKQMAFLIGIFIFTKQYKEPSLTPGNLQNIFTRINTLIFGDEETVERRANNTIAHLREQGFISKMDATGGSQYVVSALGRAVAQHWENTDQLTQQSLVLYTSHVHVVLDEIRKAAEQGGDDSVWAEKVSLPLCEIVSEVINSIDRRQQGMTQAQKRIEKEISEKISASWLDAIGSCEEMLRTTGGALDELHTVMLSKTDQILSVLEEIAELAQAAGQRQSREAVESIQSQMETIRQWSNASHEEWSRYYRNVHDFIRLHVRADPKRQAAHRVKEAIQRISITPWTFSVSKQEYYYQLREGEFTRPIISIDVTGKASRTTIEDSKPIDRTLINEIKQEVEFQIREKGKAGLVAILQKFLPRLDSAETFKVAGELVSILVARGVPTSLLVMDWTPLADNIKVQDLTVIDRKRS